MSKRPLDSLGDTENKSSAKKTKVNTSSSSNVMLQTVFADPTYDITFKMLFGNDKHKNILISLLNNLLDFVGTAKEIQDVVINSSDLQKESASGVKGAVDVLCTTVSNKKIAVEMQRQYKGVFFAKNSRIYV